MASTRWRIVVVWIFSLFCMIHYTSIYTNDFANGGPPATNIDANETSVKVYAPSNSTSNVAICLIVKNETLYLDEWIDFHIALGFSPIYIYDNSLTFELKHSPLPNSIYSWYETRVDIHPYIQLIHFPNNPVQIAAYEQCLFHDAINSTYVAMIDVDEFLVLKTFDNVVDFMDHHCDVHCGQLSINWKMMGTGNATAYSPVPITKRNVHFDRDMHGTLKVIVRPSYVDQPLDWRHSVILKKGLWFDTNRLRIERKGPKDWRRQVHPLKPGDVAVLYHYAFKSDEELYYKQCVRGDSLHVENAQCNNTKYYPMVRGWRFDDTAWRQLVRMVPKYGVAYGDAISN